LYPIPYEFKPVNEPPSIAQFRPLSRTIVFNEEAQVENFFVQVSDSNDLTSLTFRWEIDDGDRGKLIGDAKLFTDVGLNQWVSQIELTGEDARDFGTNGQLTCTVTDGFGESVDMNWDIAFEEEETL